MKKIKMNKYQRNIKEAATVSRPDLHSQVRKFESEFTVGQDKFILIPFLLKESVLFVSNMPKGNFA